MASPVPDSHPRPDGADFDASGNNAASLDGEDATISVKALSQAQERRLINYFEDKLLDITRAFKKRSQPSTTLPTLLAYLTAAHPLLSLVLQLPPADPSAALRTTLLLRLTNEVLSSFPGYAPTRDARRALAAWLVELDAGWCAVLRSQAWDVADTVGVDVALAPGQTCAPPTATDRARLRSLLIGGTDALEEWLARGADADAEAGTDAPADVDAALAALELREAFEDVFERTLAEMGALGGVGVVSDLTAVRPAPAEDVGDEGDDEDDDGDLEGALRAHGS